jgi:L-fuconolactonase
MTVVDSHQHFWSLRDPWFDWPTPDLAPIYRDIGPADLKPELEAAGVSRSILVQVAPDVAETQHLLDIADAHEFVAGVVGWVDLETHAAIADLERFAARGKFVGIRPMIQAIPDADWMLRPALAPGLAAVQRLGLTFDALVRPQHLQALCAFVDRYPDLPVVIDHGAKPAIAAGREGFAAWADPIAAVAERPQVRCKLSGLLTEAGDRANAEDLAPFIDHLLEIFGPERLMWGSDWPVVELAASYATWIELARGHLAGLSRSEQSAIFGDVASRFYRL